MKMNNIWAILRWAIDIIGAIVHNNDSKVIVISKIEDR